MKISSQRFRPVTPTPIRRPASAPASTDAFLQEAYSLTQKTRADSLHQGLFTAVQRVAALGVPGLPGVALAKVVSHALEHSPATPDDKGELAYQALAVLQMDEGVAPMARETFDQSRQARTQADKDHIVQVGLRRIACLEVGTL